MESGQAKYVGWDDAEVVPVPWPTAAHRAAPPERESKLTRLADVYPEAVDWLWDGRIPRGAITMLDGDPEVGKSTVSLDLAARVSSGSRMPDGSRGSAPGAVIVIGAEDSLAATVRPRLEGAGAVLENVYALEAIYTVDQPLGRPLRLPTDTNALARSVEQLGAQLVVIDPLMSFIDADINSNGDQEVRKVMWPLAQMAEQTGAAILIVRHLTKGSAGGPVIYRGGGSMGIIGAARSGLMAVTDPDDSTGETKILYHFKSNLSRKAMPLDYRIIADPATGVGRVHWDV